MFVRQAAAGILRNVRSFRSRSVIAKCRARTSESCSIIPITSEYKSFCQYAFRNWERHYVDPRLWIAIVGQAAIVVGINTYPVSAKEVPAEPSSENDIEEANVTGLRRIDDGSVISNIHTSKWRVYTDNGRDLFLQGKLDEAENFFLSALREAKEGFGKRDPHVASACNNLAELYRVRKAFEKAEPLYLEAIEILQESFGPEDIRVGAALHNLGQFYLVQRKLEDARRCYERALKIKGRVLGHGHADYADTMYHLGTVLYLQGNEKDSVVLIQDSIRILEEGGQGESIMCIKRLRYLAQIYLRSNRPEEAENLQRKILHILELTKGWDSMETVFAAEGLALTLQAVGDLQESQELLERCLNVRKMLLPEDHIQVGGNMLKIARVAMLNLNRLRRTNVSDAIAELDKAKDLLGNSIRIAQGVLVKFAKDNRESEDQKDGQAALIILLQSLDALGLLEITRQEVEESPGHPLEAENALRQCISFFKEFGMQKPALDSPQVKTEYLSCLKHLSNLISDSMNDGRDKSKTTTLQELNDEIKRVEAELSPRRKQRNSNF